MLASRTLKFLRASTLGLIAGILGMFGAHDRLYASEQLIVTYGAFEASFAIADLEILATTGEVPTSMDFYLGLANLEPEQLRAILTAEFNVTHRLLDDMLNSEGGEYMLSELTQVVHTPSRQANIQALRSAFVMAASDDQQITLLELLQNYPTQRVYVNGINLLRFAQDLNQEPIADGTADRPD